MMYKLARYLFAVSVVMTLIGCSTDVPLNKVYGTYKASYPFGSETITLNRDDSFVQQIMIRSQASVIVRGKWDFEYYRGSRINFDGLMTVVDRFGHLKKDWQRVPPGIASFDIGRDWFRIFMESPATSPYGKQ